MSPQRVLITNDDGIAAPGIRYLARAAADHGFDVVVAAPSEESSGISAAMTAVVSEGRVVIDRRKLAMLDSVPTFSVSASPSYIVTLARLGAFGDPPELVMSGINRGANAGWSSASHRCHPAAREGSQWHGADLRRADRAGHARRAARQGRSGEERQ